MAAAGTSGVTSARTWTRAPKMVGLTGWTVAVVVLGLLAMAAVAYFDLQTNVLFNDEYGRRWTIEHLASGHGLSLWGTNTGLVQILVALPLGWLHLEPRFFRLTGLPFLVLCFYFSARLANRLGADGFWSAVGGFVVAAAPLTLSVATGLMNETVFLGLLMGACWFGVSWVEEGRGRLWAIGYVLLATLQRQQGAALVPFIAIALLVTRPRASRKRDMVALAGLSAGALLAVKLPSGFHTVTGIGHTVADVPAGALPGGGALLGRALVHLAYPVFDLVTLPAILGLVAMPFLVALWPRFESERRRTGRLDLLPFALGVFGVLGSLKLIISFGASIFPGNVFGIWGLGPTTLPNDKPNLFPVALWVALEALTTATYVVLLLRRRRAWHPQHLGGTGVLLLGLAVSQLLPVLVYQGAFDRYFLAVLAPLAPVLAVLASRGAGRAGLARPWAVGAMAAGLLIYVAGQQDYQAWVVARDTAARGLYAQYPADQVYSGVEPIEEHVWLPAADDQTGTKPKDVRSQPAVALEFAPLGDSRPGVSYWSLAPGRIVIVMLRR